MLPEAVFFWMLAPRSGIIHHRSPEHLKDRKDAVKRRGKLCTALLNI